MDWPCPCCLGLGALSEGSTCACQRSGRRIGQVSIAFSPSVGWWVFVWVFVWWVWEGRRGGRGERGGEGRRRRRGEPDFQCLFGSLGKINSVGFGYPFPFLYSKKTRKNKNNNRKKKTSSANKKLVLEKDNKNNKTTTSKTTKSKNSKKQLEL